MLTPIHLTDAEQHIKTARGQEADLTWYRTAVARLVARGGNPEQAQLSARSALVQHRESELPAVELLGDPYTWADLTSAEWEATSSRHLGKRIGHHYWGLASTLTGIISLVLLLLHGLSLLPSTTPSPEVVELTLGLSWMFGFAVLIAQGTSAVFHRWGVIPSLVTGLTLVLVSVGAALYAWGTYRSLKPKGDSAGILR